MNTNQTSTQTVEAPRELLTTQKVLTFLAWAAILIGSMVPAIILRFFVPVAEGESVLPLWLAWTQVGVLAVMVALTWVWPAVKPLRGLFLALLAFCVGAFFISPLIRGSAAYTTWISQVSWGTALISSPITVHLVPVVLMTLTVVGSGLGRKGLFLTIGNPSAPAQRSRIFNIKETKPWNQLARQFILIFVIILVVVIWLNVQPDFSKISQALIFLPAIIIAAAVNALAEEYQYRSVLLARLEPWVKPGQAMLMSAVLFTSLHYYTGTPSGPLGAIACMFLGWVTAKSVLETRGLLWAFILHFIADFVIYFFAAMTF